MSEFWMKKMRTYFKRIDFDGDGVITQKDFVGMAEKFESSGKLTSAEVATLRENLLKLWGKYQSQVGTRSESITQASFIESIQKQISCEEHKKSLEDTLTLFFQAVDSNNDNFIQTSEYAEFFDTLGLDPALATASFEAIDTNKDQLLSQEEFIRAGSEFFTSEDKDAPTRLFWGPLVD